MHFYHLLIVLLLSFIFPFSVQAEENKGRDSLRHLLPTASLLPGWKLDTTPETAAGIELYHLINGGAEIYMRAGFKRAILASYANAKGKMINLEIFEMTSPQSALNIHKKKIGPKGKKVSVGVDAVLEDYFLNFHSGPFQVTISGYDAEPKTVQMLLDMARMVAQRIRSFYTKEK